MKDKVETVGTHKKKKMGKLQLEYLEILENKMGLVAPACQGCGLKSRSTHYRWMNEYIGFAECVSEIKENMKDFAEGKLYQAIKDGDITANIFYLKCQGKDRGYVDKQIVEVSGEIATVINIIPASSLKKGD